jgi:predicted phosphodiesterase
LSDSLKILVIGDLHCQYKSPNEKLTTRLFSNMMRDPILHNPMEALKRVIDEDELEADLILCTGDITNMIDEQGLITGWNYLEEIKRHLNVKYLAATIGNHDVDSRKIHSKDPFKSIKKFSNRFPIDSDNLKDQFWRDNFYLLVGQKFDLLVYNSSFSHIDKDEARLSRIEQSTLDKIKDALSKCKPGKTRIAMCHHHPMKHSNLSYIDEDSMDKGDDLVTLLNFFDFDLLIHGHKHDPRLSYINSLPILCAGSFSSLENVTDIAGDNVFHKITISPNKKGIIKTYVYGPNKGWHIKDDAYFPCITGFGFRGSITDLAKKINVWLGADDLRYYEDLVLNFPELNNLIPLDQNKLNEELDKVYSIALRPLLPNKPYVISKQVL